jgi:hypothetical protein
MKPEEPLKEEIRMAVPNGEAQDSPPTEQPWRDPVEVMPMIAKAVEKHRQEWRGLMKRYPYQWAAYHGDVRLEIGKSKRKLYHKYLDRGLSLEELVVLGIGPDIPAVINDDEVIEF